MRTPGSDQRSRARRAVATLATTSLLLLAPVPAHAHTERVTDETGEAGPATGLDIASATYDNTGNRVGGTVRFADLGRHGTVMVDLMVDNGADLVYLTLITRRRSHGTVRSTVTYSDYGSGRPVPCRVHGGWKLQRDLVSMRVGRACLREARPTRSLRLREPQFAADAWRGRGHDRAPRRWVHRS